MGRPRSEEPRERIKISFSQEERARVEAYAQTIGRPTSTAITHLVLAVLEHEGADGALADAQARVRDLEAELAKHRSYMDDAPRWQWPIRRLLADREWWATWLPELGRVLGRWPARADGDDPSTVDDQGYADLMSHLFPPHPDVNGRPVRWHRIEYPALARTAWWAWHENRPHESGEQPAQAQAWEPVIRHVALGLSMLEEASDNAYLTVRAKDELARGWRERLVVLVSAGQRPYDLEVSWTWKDAPKS